MRAMSFMAQAFTVFFDFLRGLERAVFLFWDEIS
jgi:hypothetical protein